MLEVLAIARIHLAARRGPEYRFIMEQMNPGLWWGRYRVSQRRTGYWQIGPLHLWIQHLPHQLRMSWEHSDDWLDPTIRVIPELENEDPPEGIFESRFVFRESSEELLFTPALANRPVVTKLNVPLQVLPGEDVMLYISTPLWVRIDLANPAKQLRDVPSFRMSDTWFGPVAQPGGILAYASRTRAALKLEDVLLRPHCATTAVHLINLADTQLLLERLSLPMPRLSLFFSPRTGFWSDMVTLERKEDNEMATLKLDRQPPPQAAPTQFVAAPRTGAGEPNMVFRAFSALFREKGD